jgi:hypothetical protein
MHANTRLWSLGAILFVASSAACSAGSEPLEDPDSVSNSSATLRNNAYFVAAQPIAIDDQNLEFASGSELAARRAGEVIVGTGATPFMRKIVRAESAPGKLVFATEPASLVDVFENAEVKVVVDATELLQGEGELPDSVTPELGTKGTHRGGANFSWKVPNLGPLTNNSVGLDLTLGELSYAPKLEFDVKIAGAKIDRLKIAFRGNFYTKVAGKLSATTSLNWKQTWNFNPNHSFKYEIPFGSFKLPIEARMSYRVEAAITAPSATISAHTVASMSADATVGYECAAGKCGPIVQRNFDFQTSPPTIAATGTANTSLELTAILNTKINGATGPYFALTPYLSGRAQGANGQVATSARVGIRGAGGGEVTIFGNTLGWKGQLFDIGRDVFARTFGAPRACVGKTTTAGSLRCNQSGLVKSYEAAERCVFNGGGAGCFTSTSVAGYQLCGASSGGGYTCDVDAIHDCLCHDGGLACFNKYCKQ